MNYKDENGEFFGRIDENGNVMVLDVEDGIAANYLDADVYPIGSELSARHEHPEGIVLSVEDAEKIGIVIEK